MDSTKTDLRSTQRFDVINKNVVVYRLSPSTALVGTVVDESIGGLGLSIPDVGELSVGDEVTIGTKGIRRTAILRHSGQNGRVGVEWKSHALSQNLSNAICGRSSDYEV